MVYHFVKHIGFDIKADSLEQAKEIAKAIDEGDDVSIEDTACDVMLDAIDDVLDGSENCMYDDVYDNSVVHAGKTEYVGYTEDTNDSEERLYDYLTDADDEDEEDDDVTYRITDKGRDWLDFVEGKYPQFDENDYDSHGNRLLPRRDGSIEDQLVRVIISALFGL